jgi:hypothetical protein
MKVMKRVINRNAKIGVLQSRQFNIEGMEFQGGLEQVPK